MKKLLRIIMLLILTVLGIGAGTTSIYYLQGILFSSASDYPILTRGNGFTMNDAEGQSHSSDEWVGQVVLLNFWATWCPPCRKEIPGFVNLYHAYHDKGFMVVGIAIDEPEKVRRFMADVRIDYPNLVGEDTGIGLATRYGDHAGGLPYTVIIDRSGKVVSTHLGELSATAAEKTIRPLL
ncbi:cytochrome c biogenesis protein CcmG, thiol:disulfide interchange protein DsbE [Gammaproteobacteria bacterium]